MYFSVIVTVYKVEPYLKQCVDSILAQTFDDFELILVDDGSPDGCADLCDEYAKRDVRVKALHQKNRGVVNARKSGLLAAKGQYVVFVDGDDWVEPFFLQRGYLLMESTRADMILFACSYEYGDFSEKMFEPAEEGLYEGNAIRERLYPTILMDSKMSHMFYSVFAKIFCRSLIESCLLKADDRVSLGEDLLCTVQAYLEAKRVYISHTVTNFYRVRKRSVSHGFCIGHYRQAALVLKKLRSLAAVSDSLPKDFDRQMERYGAHMCFVFMIHAVNDGQFQRIPEIKRQMKRPLLQECLRHARFEKISLKTKISFLLLKRNMVLLSYCFLRACRRMKMVFRGRKVAG